MRQRDDGERDERIRQRDAHQGAITAKLTGATDLREP